MENNLFQIIEGLRNEVQRTHELTLKKASSNQEGFLKKFGTSSSNENLEKIKRLEKEISTLEEKNSKLKDIKDKVRVKVKNLKSALEKIN